MSNKNQPSIRVNLHASHQKSSHFTVKNNDMQSKIPLKINKNKVRNFRSLQKLTPLAQMETNSEYNSHKKSQQLDVYIYLLYKNNKITISFRQGTPLKIVAQTLYKKILQFQVTVSKYSIQNATQEAQKVLGFQSQDSDLQFDYLLSLSMEASQKKLTSKIQQDLVLKKSKFLRPFFSKTNSKNEIFYKICKCLAIGGFSKVYLARSYTDGRFYAIKFIKKEKKNLKRPTQINQSHGVEQKFQALLNQMDISKQLDHPFLIKLYHAFETQNFYGLVEQYCPGGELFYLLKKKRIFTEKQAKFYFLQILYGISYLHQKNIIYRDLKPENVLIDWQGNLKIVDFGLSKRIGKNKQKSFSYCGSAEYMAPEMIIRSGHSYSLDYYSIGALLYELVVGLPPFYTKDEEALQQAILFQSLSFPNHVNLSNEIKDLLIKLLQKQEKYRLGSFAGLKEILFHPWIGKINSVNILQKKMQCPYPPDLKNHNFDPDQLGDDQEQFSRMVKNQLSVDSTSGSQRQKKNSPYQSFSKSLSNLNKKLHTDEPIRKDIYQNTFYKINNFTKINSKLIESAKNQVQLQKIKQKQSLKMQSSESPLLKKSNSLARINLFSVHNKTNIFYQEQKNMVKKVVKLLRVSKNHQSLDKIHQKQKSQQKTPYFPSFFKQKKQVQKSQDIFKGQKNNTYHFQKSQIDQRLFNNLKNTYLSNSSSKRKILENYQQKTLRVSKSHQGIPQKSKLIKILNQIPKKMEKTNFKKESLQKFVKNCEKSKIFANDSSVQECPKKVYASKKKFIRGNKPSLINEIIMKKNQVFQ